LTPRTLPVRPVPTPQSRRHWCRLTEKYCTRIATPFQNPRSIPLSPSKPFLSRLFPHLYRLYRSSVRVFLSSSLFFSPRRLTVACTLALFLLLSISLFLFVFSLSLFIFPTGQPGSSRYSTVTTKREKNFRCRQAKFILLLIPYCRKRFVELFAIFLGDCRLGVTNILKKAQLTADSHLEENSRRPPIKKMTLKRL